MSRVGTVLGTVNWPDQVGRLARWLNPVVASPGAPLETVAGLSAMGPSLMPRTSKLQGVSMGLSVLGARATTGVVERLTSTVVPAEAPLGRRLAARAAVGGAGLALAALPERDGERLWMASLRSTGLLLRAGAAGGAVHDLGGAVQERWPAQRAIRPVAVSAALVGGLAWWGGRRLAARSAAIEHWPLPQRSTLQGALASSLVVTAVGTGLTRGYVWSRGALESYFGPEPSKRVVARLVNAGVWAGAATAAYNAGVAYVGRANEKVDPGYATPPASPLVSGSDESLLPFADLGQQGRRYVTDVVTPELIDEVMGEEAVAHPIRAYVGFDSEPLYPTGRAELALAELDRTGAFDRSYLLLVSPTGTGWVDHTMIETAEFLTRGDIATCCVQYGRYPSFLSVQKVALGRSQFRLLLWGVKQRLEERPPDRRPKVLVFGESLGAWTSSDVVMFQGIEGFDHYGIDRALWVGLPWLAKWSRSGMSRGSTTLVPEGTVGVFDRHEQLAALDRGAAGAAAGGHPVPRQRPYRRDGPRPAGTAPLLAGRRAAGPRRPPADALDPAGHLRADDHGRGQRDGVGAGRVRLLRPRLPRRHGPVRPRRLRPPQRQRHPGRPHRGDPAVPGAGAGRPHQGRARPFRPATPGPPHHRRHRQGRGPPAPAPHPRGPLAPRWPRHTVMTSLPPRWPSTSWRMASGTSASG